ncbi:unnamed protein product [Polarella glacialis]|uniref:Thioredoxin domain-containing protein n=1 Tax=Polarella glacialis TaxID=89957 RepID=A0A813J5I6_POLGL|nr:unnamed protein product [Polarella glacialis]CAE8633135.1 unnamed protein product [Polarella glacialis]CAE8654004.1 unnamed protein product [Polarella glacialis]CAE8664994.1 unnamed protein product [Polarella glacialis]
MQLFVRSLLLLMACAVPFATAADGEFDESIPFVKAVSIADVTTEVVSQKKPAVVFVTQPWCGACKGLKRDINGNKEFQKSLDKFVVAHVVGDDGKEWQFPGETDGYIPRVYFLDTAGKMVDLKGPNAKYGRFFSSGNSVQDAALKLLKQQTGLSGEL